MRDQGCIQAKTKCLGFVRVLRVRARTNRKRNELDMQEGGWVWETDRLETGGYNTLFSLVRGVELRVEACSWVNHLADGNVNGECREKKKMWRRTC